MTAPVSSAIPAAGGAGPVLVFDGGCPFCSHFAALSALRSGIAGLQIRDGRAETVLRQQLARRGTHLRDGAVVLEGDRVWHGAEAIQWLCARMQPDAALLQLLAALFRDRGRARGLYPWLLQARRFALAWRGLSPDPDANSDPDSKVDAARSRAAGNTPGSAISTDR
ncbi:MAG: DCC1-like thiol-disulfide oxidoreductase family protein [Cyanobium sp.]